MSIKSWWALVKIFTFKFAISVWLSSQYFGLSGWGYSVNFISSYFTGFSCSCLDSSFALDFFFVNFATLSDILIMFDRFLLGFYFSLVTSAFFGGWAPLLDEDMVYLSLSDSASEITKFRISYSASAISYLSRACCFITSSSLYFCCKRSVIIVWATLIVSSIIIWNSFYPWSRASIQLSTRLMCFPIN